MSAGICQAMSLGDFQCLVGAGFDFAIIQAWEGGYDFNGGIATCVNNAWAAGMAHVDVYAFLCPNCAYNYPASSAVSSLIQQLNGVGLQGGGTGQGYFGMLWFDVEQCSGCWNDGYQNSNFIMDGVQEATSLGIHVGIYSSNYEWGATTGGSTSFTAYPLWYAHYDNNPSFSDWSYEQFGGWANPSIKQFTDNGPSCYGNLDQDWYPDSMMPTWWDFLHNTTRPTLTEEQQQKLDNLKEQDLIKPIRLLNPQLKSDKKKLIPLRKPI